MIGLAGRRTTQPLAALRSPALPLRTQRLRVRAEPGSQGPSTSTASDTVTEGDADVGQQSVPRQKSSWEMIEEPVRGGEGAPGDFPIAHSDSIIMCSTFILEPFLRRVFCAVAQHVNAELCLPSGTIPDGGRPVGQRNNQFDDLLINFDGADERSITGLREILTNFLAFAGGCQDVNFRFFVSGCCRLMVCFTETSR